MATFSDLYGEKLTRELGSADTSALFTTARRKAAINEAQLQFVKDTECFVKWVAVPLADSTQEYDLDATSVIAADDYLWIAQEGAEHQFTDADGNIRYTRGEDDFPRKDLSTMQNEGIDWKNTSIESRTPTSWYIRQDGGSEFFGLVPIPLIGVGESALVNLPYVAVPPDMTDDTHQPFSVVLGTSPLRKLRPWHQALVHYAAALLEPLRKNYQGEQRQRQLYAGWVADYLQKQRPKGGQLVTLSRTYYRDARSGRMASARLDPRRY